MADGQKTHRVLIILGSFYIGGFTKSLLHLLWCLEAVPSVQADLWVLQRGDSALSQEVPPGVTVHHYDPYTYKDPAQTKRRRIARLWQSVYYVHYTLAQRLWAKKANRNTRLLALRQRWEWFFAGMLPPSPAFVQGYDCVVSWQEVRCNYLLARGVTAPRRVGYVRPDYKAAGFCPAVDAKCFARLDATAAVAEACRDHLTEVFPSLHGRFCYVPNRKSLAWLRQLANQPVEPLQKHGLTLMTATRLDDLSKALFRQVRVARALVDQGLAFRWYVLGGGPDEAAFKAAIAAAGLADTVICLGPRDNPYPYIAQADLFVLPSYYEGRPNAVDEAKIQGTPVLVTAYDSAREQVGPNEGFVVENDECAIIGGLAAAMRDSAALAQKRAYLAAADFSAFEDCTAFLAFTGAGQGQ